MLSKHAHVTQAHLQVHPLTASPSSAQGLSLLGDPSAFPGTNGVSSALGQGNQSALDLAPPEKASPKERPWLADKHLIFLALFGGWNDTGHVIAQRVPRRVKSQIYLAVAAASLTSHSPAQASWNHPPKKLYSRDLVLGSALGVVPKLLQQILNPQDTQFPQWQKEVQGPPRHRIVHE